jgi:Fur family ferric uptake transcriptional regulator
MTLNNKVLDKAKAILDNYMEMTSMRKTPERYAIMKAIYTLDGHFTVDELNAEIQKNGLMVSRATLYNTLRLFQKIHLVVRHRLADRTKYEAALRNDSHSHLICTMCGKVTEVELPEVETALAAAHLNHFRKDGFTLYVYGVCSNCQSKLNAQHDLMKKSKE